MAMEGEGLRVESRTGGLHAVCFTAMASPCEVLVDTTSETLAWQLGVRAASEARRIESRYSRYRPDSIISRLNNSHGARCELDAETAALLEYARQCHLESGGLFDITSGVLRRVWNFTGRAACADAGDNALGDTTNAAVPSRAALQEIMSCVGFEKLDWQAPNLRLPEGMQLDFGGIGKEYAVDRALLAATHGNDVAVLVNFGGDLACRGIPGSGPWKVGVESPAHPTGAALVLEMASSGGLATSGDTHRYVIHEGKRLGHILDPRSGWPVQGGPASVTVAASSCLEAGTLATFALLHGSNATAFLEMNSVRFWPLWADEPKGRC